MKLLLCIMLAVSVIGLWGIWDWAYTIGGTNLERTWEITCDTNSNIFIAGEFADTLYINGLTLPGFGLADSFVAKYSPGGTLLWAKVFGSTEEDVALGVGIDAAGACYVSGYFNGTFTCEGQSLNSNGMWDAYLLKLDVQGNLLWLRSFGGTLNDIGYGLAVNPNGTVFVAGWFADTIKFPGGASIVSAGGSDVFCSAWDSNGGFIWAKQGGTPGVEYGYEVACDIYANAYVTGVASVGSQFGNFALDSNGVFVVKYNALGQEQWLASTNTPFTTSISVQATTNGSQYGMICGRVLGSGAIGQFPYNSIAGSEDAYYAIFDAQTGQWTDVDYFGGTLADKARDCDYKAVPAFVATFEGSAVFGGLNFSSSGESDFIIGYGDPASTPGMQWIATGGENSEVPYGIKILPNGNLAICGWHFGSGNIGGIPINTGSVSNQNAFVACYNPNTALSDELLPEPARLTAYPNPFVTSIKVLSQSLDEPLAVYNLKGQLIRYLKGLRTQTGTMEYSWDGLSNDGKPASPGIYIIKGKSSAIKALKL